MVAERLFTKDCINGFRGGSCSKGGLNGQRMRTFRCVGKKDILVGSRSMTYKWKDNVTDNVKAMVRKNIVLMKSYFNKAKDAYSRVCFTMRGQPYEKIKEALSKDKEYVESTKKSGEYSSLVTPYIERVMKTESYIYVIPGKY